MIDPELKQKWVTALRSGDYQQGKEALRRVTFVDGMRKPEYCCLGVLCDVGLEGRWDEDGGFIEVREYVTPFEFAKGMRAASTLTNYDDDGEAKTYVEGLSVVEQDALIRMNDDGGKSFSEIADWIEANL